MLLQCCHVRAKFYVQKAEGRVVPIEFEPGVDGQRPDIGPMLPHLCRRVQPSSFRVKSLV